MAECDQSLRPWPFASGLVSAGATFSLKPGNSNSSRYPADVRYGLWLRSPLGPSVLPDKLFYAFEYDVFPLCHCKLKESHRHKLGGFWPSYCELAHSRTTVHRRLLAAAELAPSKNEIRHRKPDLKLPQAIRSRALRAVV
jgi:hypothetical protein